MSAARGVLAENVVHFGRVLRSSGMPVGTDRILLALSALEHAGLGSRAELAAVLRTCLVNRVEELPLFERAFDLFWQERDLLGEAAAARNLAAADDAQDGVGAGSRDTDADNRRLSAALAPRIAQSPARPRRGVKADAEATFSEREALRRTDFASMSCEEWRLARDLIAAIDPMVERVPTRRSRSATAGRSLDWRGSLKATARSGTEVLRWRSPRLATVPFVILLDISGSMSRYSRTLLHFAHALARHDVRTHVFVFGTRLTPVSRQLRQRDVDVAMARVADLVNDWSGGTRIHTCLKAFNQDWSRRVLGQKATLLLVTDGLEQGDATLLSFEMERLAKSCRRLVWLNPLLRYPGFEARAQGIRAMLPWVDDFLPMHNLESLEDLARALATKPRRNRAPAPISRAIRPSASPTGTA